MLLDASLANEVHVANMEHPGIVLRTCQEKSSIDPNLDCTQVTPCSCQL